MPRDKEASHKRVLEAAKSEFLIKGYENASIRAIGEKAGMTSAGLYRHCKDKEDLFCQVLEPLMTELELRINKHRKESYEFMKENVNFEIAFNLGEIQIFKDMMRDYRDELKLLLCHSTGTRFENFKHNLVHVQEREMFEALDYLKSSRNINVEISKEAMHVLLSAYVTAILEPVVHDYNEEETQQCLAKISEFFMPGWKKIMGL